MLQEKIKIAAETAVRRPAKLSGIFPQPEEGLMDCQTQVCFSNLFLNVPKASGSLYPTIFISIITKPYFSMSVFSLTVIILSFRWPSVFHGLLPVGHKSLPYWIYCKICARSGFLSTQGLLKAPQGWNTEWILNLKATFIKLEERAFFLVICGEIFRNCCLSLLFL